MATWYRTEPDGRLTTIEVQGRPVWMGVQVTGWTATPESSRESARGELLAAIYRAEAGLELARASLDAFDRAIAANRETTPTPSEDDGR